MAPRFQYSFQKVVDLKESETTQAEWILSASLGKLQIEETHLFELQMEKNNTLEAIQQESVNCASVSSLQQMQFYLSGVEARIIRQEVDVRIAKMDVERNQVNLSDKMKDEKVWLKAKERAKDRFVYEMQLREQNELDEIATIRHAMGTN